MLLTNSNMVSADDRKLNYITCYLPKGTVFLLNFSEGKNTILF